jgi:hypothetical protein
MTKFLDDNGVLYFLSKERPCSSNAPRLGCAARCPR